MYTLRNSLSITQDAQLSDGCEQSPVVRPLHVDLGSLLSYIT